MIPTHRVHHRGGDIFDVFKEPSDKCVLWGELVTEKERRFLGKTLRSDLVCFSVRDTFQISVRTCFRPESATIQRHCRKGRFAMLLHDTSGRLTTSWTWLKLVKPLYKIGLSVILVDLPGLGKSSINNVSTLHSSVWQEHEGHILCKILDELKISKCHLVACGNSCSALIRISKHLPHQLEKEHILHNPVLDYSELFKDAVPGPAPDTGPNWRDILRAEQQRELESFLVTSEVRIFASFDEAELGRTRETWESFTQARNHCLLCETVTSKQVSKEDICEVQVGADVPVSFLFVGKELRQCYAQFLQEKQKQSVREQPPRSSVRTQPRSSVAPVAIDPAEEAAHLAWLHPLRPMSPISPVSLEQEVTAEVGGMRAPRPSLAALPSMASKSKGALENLPPPRALENLPLPPRTPALVLPVEDARSEATPTSLDARGGAVVPWSAPPRSGGSRHKAASTDSSWADGAARHPAAVSEWSSSTNGTLGMGTSSRPARGTSSYTADSAKREALGKMPCDPHEQRRKLLSTLPGRWRHKLLSLRADQSFMVGDIEPENNQEERSMVVEAVRASLQTLAEENQARRQAKKPQRTIYLGR